MITHIMKTTIELPDRLFAEVKAAALRRRTTMKALMEHALRREVAFGDKPAADAAFELNQYGFPVLKKRDTAVVSSAMVYDMIDAEGT